MKCTRTAPSHVTRRKADSRNAVRQLQQALSNDGRLPHAETRA
jgi:hypothetical protein